VNIKLNLVQIILLYFNLIAIDSTNNKVHIKGRPDPECPGGHRAGRLRADPRQPAHQPVRDPRRPGAFRGDKQPAVPGRPDRSQLSRRTTPLVSSLHYPSSLLSFLSVIKEKITPI